MAKKPSKKRVKTAGRAKKKASKPAKKRATKPAKKKAPRAASRKKPAPRKTRSSSQARSARRASTAPSRNRQPNDFADTESGDLQGLSRAESVDSESVDELLEEGNAFEAGVISGVEEADDEEGREVHTHEVPEDDVPKEYLDED